LIAKNKIDTDNDQYYDKNSDHNDQYYDKNSDRISDKNNDDKNNDCDDKNNDQYYYDKNNYDKNNDDKNNDDKNNDDKSNDQYYYDKNNYDKNNDDKNNDDKNNDDKNNDQYYYDKTNYDKNNYDKNNDDKNNDDKNNDQYYYDKNNYDKNNYDKNNYDKNNDQYYYDKNNDQSYNNYLINCFGNDRFEDDRQMQLIDVPVHKSKSGWSDNPVIKFLGLNNISPKMKILIGVIFSFAIVFITIFTFTGTLFEGMKLKSTKKKLNNNINNDSNIFLSPRSNMIEYYIPKVVWNDIQKDDVMSVHASHNTNGNHALHDTNGTHTLPNTKLQRINKHINNITKSKQKDVTDLYFQITILMLTIFLTTFISITITIGFKKKF